MWVHNILWRSGTSLGAMPWPVLVKPSPKLDEIVMKAAGRRYRKRKGIWLSVSIQWALYPSEISLLEALLEAEKSDATAFELSLDNGAHYYYAQLSKDPAYVPISSVNTGMEVTLEFEYRDRLASLPSPLHMGQ